MNANDVNAVIQGAQTPFGLIMVGLFAVVLIGLLVAVVGYFLRDMRSRLDQQLKSHGDELREIRKEMSADIKELQTKFAQEMRDIRQKLDGDTQSLRDRMETQVKELRDWVTAETQRLWTHIARHEKSLPERFALREDMLREDTALDQKIDQGIGGLPCRNGGRRERDAAVCP